MEEFNSIAIIVIGLIIGSFLNVLIYRLPYNISLFSPSRSICPSCNKIIAWYQNIPVLSYLLLQARCSSCNNPISIVYPCVEIITSLITYILYLKLGFSHDFYYLAIISYLLIVLSFIDLKFKAVPDSLLIITTTITLIYLFVYKIENISTYFIFAGAIITIDTFVTYYIQNIKAKIVKNKLLETQRAIGEGDIPIIALIGGILGLKFGIIAIFISAVLAIIPSIINMALKREIETPFIPFLSLGFIITYTYEATIEQILKGLNIL